MEEDHISALPDDILLSIISLLPMREASRTAILSRRWRLLAKCVSNLIFQVNNMLGDVFNITLEQFDNLDENERKAFLLKRRLNLVPAIDQFLQLRPHGHKMEYLRIYSTLNTDHTSYLDRWIGHAFSCGIEELDISLHELSFSSEPEHDDKYYSFPFHLLVPKEKCFSSLKGLNPKYLTMRPPLNFCGFKSLTRLYLLDVKISDTELEQVLSGSSLLEDLGVGYCPELVDLRIPSNCFRIEKLGVTSCSKLKNIHVNTPSVTSLDYDGCVINFYFDNVSLVKDVIYGIDDDDYRDGINHVFTEFPELLPQLEYLEISYGYKPVEDEGLILDYFPQFMNLKKFVISGSSKTIDNLLWIISLLWACPLLEV